MSKESSKSSKADEIVSGMDDKQFDALASKVASEHRKRHGAMRTSKFDDADLANMSDGEFAAHKNRVFAEQRTAGHRKAIEAENARLANDARTLDEIAGAA